MKVKKAIIPAAGLGTRFLPATKAQPKEMLPIIDKPTIQYIVEEAVSSGIEDIIIITGRGKRAIEDHFDKSIELELKLQKKGINELLNMVEEVSSLANIHYIRQKEPKGLGHAVYCAKSFIGNEPFAVLLGDNIIDSEVPCLKQLMDMNKEYKGSILGVQEVPYDQVEKYGIIKYTQISDRIYKVDDLIEKPKCNQAPSNLAILGRYILVPEVFDILENIQPGSGGEIQLTDALRELNKSQEIYACRFEGICHDIGDKMGFLKATVELAIKREDIGREFKDYLHNLIKGF